MKIILFSVLCILFVILCLLTLWSYPWSIGEKTLEQEIIHKPTSDSEPISSHILKIQTWNLGFLYGEGSQGIDYQQQSKDFYLNKLQMAAEQIKSSGANIVFLQEVDFASARSHFIDQAQFLAEAAGFDYVAKAISWELNYLPFPYWPINNQFGRLSSGGAILSKFPIIKNEVDLLQKPSNQPWWYNLFYLHRYFQKVQIQLNDRIYHVINLHLESFSKENRQQQTKLLIEMIKKYQPDIIAGDFNMLPPSASQRSGFKLAIDNYENDVTYDLMMTSGMAEVIPDPIYAKDESRYFTFPSSKPDRRLDYIWYRKSLKMIKAEVLPSALSDHLPLRADIQISNPEINPYIQ